MPIGSIIALIIFSILYCYLNFKKFGYSAVDIMFLFVLSIGFTSIGNLLGYLSIGKSNESVYIIYAKKEYLSNVVFLIYISSIATVAGFNLGKKIQILPSFKTIKLSNKGSSFLFYLSILSVASQFTKLLPEIGTILTTIYLLPVLSIFILARLSALFQNRRLELYSIVLLIITTIYAVFFEYLRINMIIPSVAYILGHLVGSKNIKSLFGAKLYVIYIFIGVFLTYFSIFGNVRTQYVEGLQRIELLQKSSGIENEGTFFSRLSILNQVSNIFSLVDQNGYYNGKTLEYMGFALIPRVLWPAKPKIVKGRWFALEIGQAIDYGKGNVNNSVNMTVPGELYLNFGWPGAIIGSLLFGLLVRAFWNTTKFWLENNNLFGNLFGFYLLFIGLFSLGADLQIIVTLLALYIIFFVSSIIINAFR